MTQTDDTVLQVDDLAYAYPDQPPLWRCFAATVRAGVTLLHGDTGSGKTTLLRLLSGAEPVAGRLVLGGVALADDPAAYRREVFLCDPATEAFDAVPARDCSAALCFDEAGFDAPLWHALVEGFGLLPHLDKPVYMLSTGSRRKLWLAAALAAGRRLTLLDEPTAALDAASVRCLWSALARRGAAAGAAVLVASAADLGPVPLVDTITLPPR